MCSQVKGETHKENDINLGFLFPHSVSPAQCFVAFQVRKIPPYSNYSVNSSGETVTLENARRI